MLNHFQFRKKQTLLFLSILLFFSCDTWKNDEMCKIINGPIALDFKLGMTRDEYYRHRDKLIKDKKLIPSHSHKPIEGDRNKAFSIYYENDYDRFDFLHKYYDVENKELADAGFQFALMPYFSPITNKLYNLSLVGLPYDSGPFYRTSFLGITAFIRLIEKKYGGSTQYIIDKEIDGMQLHAVYDKTWKCENIEINLSSSIRFNMVRRPEEKEFFVDINSQLISQKQAAGWFPGYSALNGITYLDVNAQNDIWEKENKDRKNNDDLQEEKAKKANANQEQNF